MEFKRTPEEAFANIDFEFEAKYLAVTGRDGTALRMHYLDEGPPDGEVILCLHGQPSWSYLYRKLVAPLTAAGFRVVAPDLIGFGRSDKPTRVEDYSYAGHVDWLSQFIKHLNLTRITGLFQDWGGMLGMRLVAQSPELFARVIVANTMLLDTNDIPLEASEALADAFEAMPIPSAQEVQEAFASGNPAAAAAWIKYAVQNPEFSVEDIFTKITGKHGADVLRGYTAPFPDDSYLAGVKAFTLLFPIMPHHQKDREENARAWGKLANFSKPLMTAFSDGDPVTRAFEARFRETIPGASGVAHTTIKNAGHFLFDEQPESIANAVLAFIGKEDFAKDGAKG